MSSRQYLELMGIDVWRRRPVRAPAAEVPAVAEANASSIDQVKQSLAVPEAASSLPVAKPAPEAQPVSIEAPVQIAPGPSFLLVCARYPGVSVASWYSADLAGIPDNHRRFLMSIEFALSGQNATPELFDFRWPMVKSKHISQTMEEAAEVMKPNLNRLSGQLLVFGESAYSLFGVVEGEPYQVVEVAGKTLWLLPELESFFANPLSRRQLWRHINKLQAQ